MLIRLRWTLVMAVGAVAGCLNPNPNLSSGDSEGEGTSTGREGSGGATEPGDTSTTLGPTADPDSTTSGEPPFTTGLAACGAGNVCAPEVPAGWLGPVVRVEGSAAEDSPACPDSYPEPAFEAYTDLQGAPAECSCECGPASGASCGNLTLEYHRNNDTCVGGAFNEFSIGASCQQGPAVDSSNRYWSVDPPGVVGGSCTPSEGVAIPEASWSGRTTACSGALVEESGACDGAEACVPEPSEGVEPQLCVWQPGAMDCPEGAYADRFLLHADFTDSRGCAACTCGSAEGDCVGSVRLWSTNNCSGGGGQGSVSIGGGCVQVASTVSSADHGALSVSNVSCEPSRATTVGEAEAVDPYTLCCVTP